MFAVRRVECPHFGCMTRQATLLVASLGRNEEDSSWGQPKSSLTDFWVPICWGHFWLYSEKNKGGWKTQGRGKHTIKPLPKNGFGPPHLWYVFSPPVCFRPVVFLRGNRLRPGKSNFLRPPKLALEGALYGTFSPAPKSHDTFCPPH